MYSMQTKTAPKQKVLKKAVKRGKKYLIGNWKMNPETLAEAKVVFAGIKKASTKAPNVKIVICPPFVYLPELGKKGSATVSVGVQNIFPEPKGSFTGETSVGMAKQFGASHVIIGHSERRVRGETDLDVSKKAQAALNAKLTAIVCLGESERDTDGKYLHFIANQLATSLSGIDKKQMANVLLAYEPVWAIGAKEAMSAHDLHQMVIFIKKTLISLFDAQVADKAVILYGGSVNAENAEDIVMNGEVNGLLVGRESLKAESFAGIINAIK